jgi:hypothetical protein
MEVTNMDNKGNLEQLLSEYGYPKDAIHRFMQEVEGLDFEEVKKRIMPFRDITAHRANP